MLELTLLPKKKKGPAFKDQAGPWSRPTLFTFTVLSLEIRLGDLPLSPILLVD
jgi:hypothetical protein